ncbi:nascent polypeptide-associated complex subunit alpha [Angomonas deanei]|uniref:NAC domain containing protein, putative n=1 Tax=Angomonas deanei TaxID=59799 RepID=S9UIY2_9TRYP|nr:nascent polypeptide-associated complex subunit alpha [Angomonas deanei]EPY28694.1 nascent polypeptide-associated complex subunit alpha [Angomonas deanei]CAD2220235.1 NAC domain containing protein, putative [Angomonas deanei]CAD2220238.1 NAC domain containing protein, putative [Angomonas deanei]|eukprot:EPY25395.1 nascent polypeptide-associated complex subunit alpha [Angomonas deanei]
MSAEDAKNAAVEEEVPELEPAEVTQGGKQSKRYAKAMAKMGLKPEPNIAKVAIRKAEALSFAIPQPEVYRFPGTNTFIIFGEAQIDSMGALAQEAAARAAVGGEAAEAGASKVEEVEDEAEEDAGDIPEKEIEVVKNQANVSRNKAIKALKNNNGDVVNAIMELTM